ncbi:MAG: ATP phosphoribosyltransferase [Anaerolineae bacterium]
MPTDIRIALPSKGALGDATLDFLEEAGLGVNKTNPRQYTATIPALPGVQVLFQRPADIPLSVARGDVDLGVTGFDRVAEAHPKTGAALLVLHEALGYGHCGLVLAVPVEWTDVTAMAALAEKARERGGLRVATKYHHLVSEFLARHGVGPFELVYADGALEITPLMGSADLIADISATGTTLRENGLKPLSDGTVLHAQACLIGNRPALQARGPVLDVARRLLEYIEAHLAARGRVLLIANMRGESAERVAERVRNQTELGGLTGPTIARVYARDPDAGWFSVTVVVFRERLYEAIGQLRAIGGSGVVVTPLTYIFDEYPERCRALDAALGGD